MLFRFLGLNLLIESLASVVAFMISFLAFNYIPSNNLFDLSLIKSIYLFTCNLIFSNSPLNIVFILFPCDSNSLA